jgi:tape measure domain-containing protein
MSSNIDEEIVKMTFQGSTFASDIKSSVTALTTLKNGLNSLKGSEDDINNLDSAGKKFSLAGMASGIEGISSKFSALGIVGITVLSNLVSKAVDAGISLVKSLTIDPIKEGLETYETKINAIQVILANTSSAGTNLQQVTAALNQLNQYANLTVYNFGQMAQNIGTFTAAGVDLKTSVSSIKGIANLAALSGASAEQASTAMYQLSQAIASGSVKLQDWNSVVNAGLGGKVFQNALEQTAKATGVNIDAIIAKAGSFRNSLQQGWLTSKILTETLSTFTGDLSAAQLKAMGFTDKEAQAILKQADAAVTSATQIRTLTQLFDALGEEVGTAWASIFQAIIGNSVQAAATLTALHNTAETALTKPIYDLAKIIQSFTDLGGRQDVIQAITNAFHDLESILKVIGEAFKEVFPTTQGGASDALVAMAKAVEKLTADLKPSKQALNDIKIIFVGLFSAIKLGIDVVAALFGGVSKIGDATKGASTGILALLATIAQWITNLKKAVESGNILTKFFNTLGSIIAVPVKAISTIINSLGGFSGAVTGLVNIVSPVVQKIGQEFSGVADAIGRGLKSGNFASLGAILNEALLAGLLTQIKKFFKGLGEGSESSGLFSTIKESFEGLTESLKTMQTTLKAATLEKIAIAVAILAASLLALSLVNVGNLTKALSAMTVMFTQLVTALAVVAKISGTAGILKMGAVGVALNLLATAILILAGAVAILAQFSWTELAKGLGSITVLLTVLVGAMALMSGDSKGVITSAYAMETMAVAMNVMSVAVKRLGSLDFATLAKGIGSVAALLLIIAGFQKISGGEQLIATAAAMILISAGLVVMATAVAKLGSLSIGTLVKGISAIAVVLTILTVALNLMILALPGAAALVVAAGALLVLSFALQNMGSQSWNSIAKALVLLASSLIIISAAMVAMIVALPGAAALLVVAGALAVLAPVLILLGAQSWESIAKGLVTLAGVFVIFGVAGLVLGPVTPILLALGIAIALFGVGILAAGAGVLLFATGLTALAVAVTAGGAAIVSFVKSILSLIPTALQQIGLGIVAFAQAIGSGGVAITNAFTVILTALLNAVIKVIPLAAKAFDEFMTAALNAVNKDSPKIITTFLNLMVDVLSKLASYTPKLTSAGVEILVALINGIAQKASTIVGAATNLVISFINAIGQDSLKITNAGVTMIINFINGLANQIRASGPKMGVAGANLAEAIIQGMIGGLAAGVGSLVTAAENLAKSALNAAKGILESASPSKAFARLFDTVPQGAALGVNRSSGIAIDSVQTMGNTMLDALGKTLSGLNDVIVDNMDLQPKITPVIDLTKATQGFSKLSSLSKNQLIAATASTSSAVAISAAGASQASQAASSSRDGNSLTFNQNNYSPIALSAGDIYRKTKNQLSIARGALGANTS